MTNSEKIKQILLSEIGKMNQHREDFCKRPGIDFTRDRRITFDSLLHFQISMESGSVNHELLKYFDFDATTPPLSAFYQQRAKLSDDVFQNLFYNFNRFFKPKSLLKGRYQKYRSMKMRTEYTFPLGLHFRNSSEIIPQYCKGAI